MQGSAYVQILLSFLIYYYLLLVKGPGDRDRIPKQDHTSNHNNAHCRSPGMGEQGVLRMGEHGVLRMG